MGSECLFCGTAGAGVLSKEHVIPKWLLLHLNLPPNDQMFYGVADSTSGELTRQRVHSSFTFVEGRVCEKNCNNGWMRRLENAAKPILVPLIDGQQPPSELSSAGRTIVAKWTAKTAYVHSWAGLMKEPIQREHLQALNGDNGSLPPGVGIFAMQAGHAKPSSYIQSGQWPQLGHGTLSDTPASGAYKVGLQFGHLHLLTAFWPGEKAHLTLTPRHFPVWPIKAEPWPKYDGWIPSNASIDPLGRFTSELAVLHAAG
jgi:hypothetical protein